MFMTFAQFRGVCSDEIQVVRHRCAAFKDPLWLIALIRCQSLICSNLVPLS